MPKIIVVNYDPAWPAAFERIRAAVWPSIRDVASSVEHIGSTSVVGLAAKPIIDATIVVPTASAMPIVIGRLATLGYQHCGNLGVYGREAFTAPPATPPHHLYACVTGSDGLHNHVTLRDYLQSNPTAAQAYSALKKQLAQQFADDIDGYTAGKSELILAILARSRFTPAQLAAIRAINSKPS
ncbi:MAG TPA: GrpB family protein [Tepidisphaeraceae bacterium]|nr:GrpB family protein [Tepidisphaeraceae bacterium]